MNMMQQIDDFLNGQADCHRGLPHKPGQSKDYDRGYAAQYELEQMNNERTRNEPSRSQQTARN